jgi:uncharacterized protein
MRFRAPSARSLRWSAWEGCEGGLEHLDIRPDGSGIIAEGIVAGTTESEAFGLTYRLAIDGNWLVRDAQLRTMSGQSLHLAIDDEGAWRVNGRARPDLQDCVDIDIEASPFTNTLPIRRLALTQGEGAAIRLVYVRVPSLNAEPGRQRYTALEAGSLYRFESLDSGFTADLPVDEQGFIADYPGLFKRLTC